MKTQKTSRAQDLRLSDLRLSDFRGMSAKNELRLECQQSTKRVDEKKEKGEFDDKIGDLCKILLLYNNVYTHSNFVILILFFAMWRGDWVQSDKKFSKIVPKNMSTSTFQKTKTA